MTWSLGRLGGKRLVGLALACSVPMTDANARDGLRGSLAVENGRVIVSDRIFVAATTTSATVEVDFNQNVDATAYILPNPFRVIIDLPSVTFDLERTVANFKPSPMVRAYRFGHFAPGKSRMVFDAGGPIILDRIASTAIAGGRSRLILSLRATTQAEFAALQSAGLMGAPPGADRPRRPLDSDKSAMRDGRHVIVIDPGHGGLDPGATVGRDVAEKDVVLAVARKLAATLRSRRGYKVLMTRVGDEFVSLKDRQEFSRESGADLFVSLHADALAETELAESIGGATVYTLGSLPSDTAARRLAEKENQADLAAGLELEDNSQEDKVRNILNDLTRRETSVFSASFRKTLIKNMKGRMRLSRAPARSAAFAVLKQSETPAVLIELGYVSNGTDRKNLTSPSWQGIAARTIAQSIDTYFARR